MAVRVIEVHESVFAEKDRIARETRRLLKAQGTFMVNLMASPGAGKTTTLLRTFNVLREEYSCGVMEADIDATVDADRMQAAGVRTIQVHTGGACAMDAVMTRTRCRLLIRKIWICWYWKTSAIWSALPKRMSARPAVSISFPCRRETTSRSSTL